MAFIPREYNDPLCVYSLRLLVSGYGGPIARVVRESDLIEGDVYPDSNNQISYDSTIIVNPNETSALTLGGFLNISGYGNPDGLADVYEARINKLYDQSAAVNHVVAPNFATSLAFVEHTLPAIFPNSTNIHTVNGIPSFLPLSTIPSLTINNVRGRELSFHFVSENTSATTYFGFINLTPYYTVSGAWNESNSSVTTGVTPFSSEAWLMGDNYYNGVLGDVAGEFTRTRIGIPTDASLVCTIQAQLLDTSYTQSDFPDNSLTLSIFSNQWYADIIAYDGYDNIRRLTIEDLLSSGNVNVETKAFTSTLAFTDDGTVDNSFIAQFGTPAAAYSVRSLRGLTGLNGPKVLRVRREVDNAEVDVYTDSTGWVSLDSPVVIVPAITGQIDGGTGVEIESLASTLGEFVADGDHDDVDSLGSPTTAKVVVWYDQSSADYTIISEEIDARGAPVRIRVVGGTYDAYEFDLYFDDNESISLSSYVADTYEISDGATQVTANLTLGTLQTLVDAGMTDATVCVWYDQSGNGNDAEQTTTTLQAKIYDATADDVLTNNGKPALQPTGAPGYASGISGLTNATIFAVGNNALAPNSISTVVPRIVSNYQGSGSIQANQFILRYRSDTDQYNATTSSGSVSVAGNGQPDDFIATFKKDGATGYIAFNGSSYASAAIASITNELYLFEDAGGGNAELITAHHEIIIYDSAQSDTNRTSIESNINTYYDIYGTGNTGVNTPLLDTYSDAVAAYSLRKLRTSYNGPVNLSKRKDAIQNVATAQPTIYNGGLITENSRGAIYFNTTSKLASTNVSSFDNTNEFSAFTVLSPKSLTSFGFYYSLTDENGGDIVLNYSLTELLTFAAYIPLAGPRINYKPIDLSQYIFYTQAGASARLDINEEIHTGTVDISAFSKATILEINNKENLEGDANYQELIFWADTKQDDVNDIKNNINSAFQIYAANFSSVLDTVPLAKAAYSIRRLTKNYIDPIITVTNGSTTKDFYADFWGNLDVDALTSFANGGTLSVTKWWDQSGREDHLLATATNKPTLTISNGEVSVNTNNKFDTLLLDEYDGAAAAYSLRQIKRSYEGPLVRVRRDVTNTEVDVYPDENLTISLNSPVLNVVDETTTGVIVNPADTLANTLGEFVADAAHSNPDSLVVPASAFVVVWYDQANSNNASQDISIAQPKIYDSVNGVVLENGKPAVEFDGSNYYLETANFASISTSGASAAVVFNPLITANVHRIIDHTDYLIQSYSTTAQWNGSGIVRIGGTYVGGGAATTLPLVQQLMYSGHDSTNVFSYINGVVRGTNSLGGTVTIPSSNFRISSPSNPYNGTMQEIVLYNSDQSPNRTNIEASINNHYQIPNFNATASTAQTVAVYNNAINTTVDLNATYTDLKEIIKYE